MELTWRAREDDVKCSPGTVGLVLGVEDCGHQQERDLAPVTTLLWAGGDL